MRCFAQNQIGNSSTKAHVLLGDIKENLTIYGIDESEKIARGDEVILTCAALPYYLSDNIGWYKDGLQLYPNESK